MLRKEIERLKDEFRKTAFDNKDTSSMQDSHFKT